MNLKDIRVSIDTENQRARLRATLNEKLHAVHWFVEKFNEEPHFTKYADHAMGYMFEAIRCYEEWCEFESRNSHAYYTSTVASDIRNGRFKGE